MKRMLVLSVICVLAMIATAAGQNAVLVTTRPGTANNNGSLSFWCQLGPPGTFIPHSFTAFMGPVPITITGSNYGSYGDLSVAEEAPPNSFFSFRQPTFYGDFLQGDCLLAWADVDLKFNQGVSQVGAQIVFGHPGSDGVLMEAFDHNGVEIGNPIQVTIPPNQSKEDGSAGYYGIEDRDSSGNPTPGIYEIRFQGGTGDPMLFNELSITAPNDRGCYTPPNTTMVAWYPFDEPSPLTTSSNLASANSGTQHNGPLGIAAGKVAGAASFNGTQYVESPSTIATNFGPGVPPNVCAAGPGYSGSGAYSACLGNFSIDTWVNIPPTAPVNYMAIVNKLTTSPLLGYSFAVLDFNGGQYLRLLLADPVNSSEYSSPALIPQLYDGTWHHIAVTVNRNPAILGITWYYDGAFIGNSTNTRLRSLVNSSPLRIGTGAGFGPFSDWFNGSLDELEIYNRELTGAEVTGIYRAGSHGKCK